MSRSKTKMPNETLDEALGRVKENETLLKSLAGGAFTTCQNTADLRTKRLTSSDETKSDIVVALKLSPKLSKKIWKKADKKGVGYNELIVHLLEKSI